MAGREGFEPSNARSKAWCLASLATAQHVNRAPHRPVSCRTPRSTSANNERRNQVTVSPAGTLLDLAGRDLSGVPTRRGSRDAPSRNFMNGMLLGKALACQRDAAVFVQLGFSSGSGERLRHLTVAANRRIAHSREAIATKAVGSQTTAGSAATNIASIAVPIHEQVSARIATEFITDCHLPISRCQELEALNMPIDVCTRILPF